MGNQPSRPDGHRAYRLSAATFMTLLAQRRLITETASTQIEALLKNGCGFVNVDALIRDNNP